MKPLSLLAFLLCAAASWVTAQPANADLVSLSHVYDVHEWGLIRYSASERPELATSLLQKPMIPIVIPPIPPPLDPPPLARKPLIYFHPESNFDAALNITATVRIPGGKLREVWPTPDNGPQPSHGESFSWTLTIQPDARCGAGVAPSLTAPPCASLTDGGVCEAAELSEYLGEVAHCLKVFGKGQFAPVLLYNAYIEQTAPAAVVVDASGAQLRSLGVLNVGPLMVKHDGALYWVERLEKGKAITLDASVLLTKVEGGDTRLQETIAASLTKQGLSDRERDDFMAAWKTLLTGTQPWQVFGFYDPTAINTMLPLTFDPAPREVRRVLAFTVEP